jgi:hypothetical protein
LRWFTQIGYGLVTAKRINYFFITFHHLIL